MPKLPIDLNTAVQDALQTRNEVIAAAQAQGHAVEAAVITQDPTSGVLRLELSTADVLSQNAIDAITANNGAAKLGPALPDAFFTNDLDAADGIAFSAQTFTALGTAVEMQAKAPDTNLGGATNLGFISGPANAYVDQQSNNNPSVKTHTLVHFVNKDASVRTLGLNEVTIHRAGMATVTFPKVSPIVLPAKGAGASDSESIRLWLDNDLNCYTFERSNTISGVFVQVIPFTSFEDAVAAGITF